MLIPTSIKLHKASRILELHYGSDSYRLPAEFLRVHSPSAEVQGLSVSYTHLTLPTTPYV